jgi:hypothetical protein
MSSSLLLLSLLAAPALAQPFTSCPSVGGTETVCFLWYSNDACLNASTSASLVVQRNGVCALVPSSFPGVPFSSYIGSCNPSGSGGAASFCASTTCDPATCIDAPFTSGLCAANSLGFGSNSVEVFCSAAAATSTPSPAASPSPQAPVSGAAPTGLSALVASLVLATAAGALRHAS